MDSDSWIRYEIEFLRHRDVPGEAGRVKSIHWLAVDRWHVTLNDGSKHSCDGMGCVDGVKIFIHDEDNEAPQMELDLFNHGEAACQ